MGEGETLSIFIAEFKSFLGHLLTIEIHSVIHPCSAMREPVQLSSCPSDVYQVQFDLAEDKGTWKGSGQDLSGKECQCC